MLSTKLDLDETFDVIIAGAGPAGCVLAHRLSESPDRHVLLIEAGPDFPPGAEPPDLLDPFALSAYHNPAFQWPGLFADMRADPGDGVARQRRPYAQGCCVGGGSNINGMGMDRGLPGDYEQWCELGAAGWGWKDVLPYFKKLEHDLDFLEDSSLHGDRGPMPVRRLPQARWAPFATAMGEALRRRGFPFLADYVTDVRDGFGSVPTNCLPERRMSASMAYLTQEVRRRRNLTLLSSARVDRIHIEGKRANGVWIHHRGATRLVRGREVIVCGGALHSPALLMRSGIGPREHLAQHGIEVVQDLPGVGANLQNHPCLSLNVYLARGAAQPRDNVWLLQNWLRFSSHYPGCARSDMHLMTFNKCAWHALGRRTAAIAVSVLNAYSKGRVELASADPDALPKVHCNLFGDRRDYERLVRGVRLALEVLTDPHVAGRRHQIFFPNYRLVASLTRRTAWNAVKARAITWLLEWAPLRTLLLGKSRIDFERLLADENALRELVWKHSHLQLHVCGTCRMGDSEDRDAVVDSAGRVRGIEALRVADASIFPTIPRGYPHFIVIMAAEKIADAVKLEWRAGRPLENPVSA